MIVFWACPVCSQPWVEIASSNPEWLEEYVEDHESEAHGIPAQREAS